MRLHRTPFFHNALCIDWVYTKSRVLHVGSIPVFVVTLMRFVCARAFLFRVTTHRLGRMNRN